MIENKHLNLNWFDRAVCRSMGTEIFFPRTCVGVSTVGIYKEAIQVCERCPVASKCLDYAMNCEKGDIRRYGVWGGKTPRQREYLEYGGTVQSHHFPMETPEINELPRSTQEKGIPCGAEQSTL